LGPKDGAGDLLSFLAFSFLGYYVVVETAFDGRSEADHRSTPKI
jgi:hypothetical protein